MDLLDSEETHLFLVQQPVGQLGLGPTTRQQGGGFDSRVFALSLIALASFYILVMICKAYMNNMDESNDDGHYAQSYTYDYATPSYDFMQYQSHDDKVQINREFEYN